MRKSIFSLFTIAGTKRKTKKFQFIEYIVDFVRHTRNKPDFCGGNEILYLCLIFLI